MLRREKTLGVPPKGQRTLKVSTMRGSGGREQGWAGSIPGEGLGEVHSCGMMELAMILYCGPRHRCKLCGTWGNHAWNDIVSRGMGTRASKVAWVQCLLL